MDEVKVFILKQEFFVEQGTFLSVPLKAAGFSNFPCGGGGRCGGCRVVAAGGLQPPCEQEKAVLSAQELESGIRLACFAKICGDVTVTPLFGNISQIETGGTLPLITLDKNETGTGLAVDLGTTTIAARLYCLTTGELLCEAANENPQRAFGSDVISRILFSLNGGGEKLKSAAVGAISALVQKLDSTNEINRAVIVGNTAMLHLLCGEDVKPLSAAPFEAKRLFGETLSAGVVKINGLNCSNIYIPNCISAFVGADITAAIVAYEIMQSKKTIALCDLGTNGEIALWHNGKLLCTSTAAGPAFEGAGLECGCSAVKGAICGAKVIKNEIKLETIGNATAVGICGSGIVAIAAALLQNETLDETGRLSTDIIELSNKIFISQKDIRSLQLAKAAIAGGLQTLLKTAGITENDLDELIIAGGFGSYLDLAAAREIGLIPKSLLPKTKCVGNAALAGASAILLDKTKKQAAIEISQLAQTVELSGSKVFFDNYTENMMF